MEPIRVERYRRRHVSSSSGQLEKMSEVVWRLRKVGTVVDKQMTMVNKMLGRETESSTRRLNIVGGLETTKRKLNDNY